ncbi:hypothetical protein [Deinococcus misasensis]|uniref:hypothetical protein n=1 Tax=Deinococcus misasensis TaxID=392413 RepID=UPI000A6E1FBC|nr:hypothetical protein [Deinococcus misasensis]
MPEGFQVPFVAGKASKFMGGTGSEVWCSLMRADQQLYWAKNEGRECIVHLLKTHRTPL